MPVLAESAGSGPLLMKLLRSSKRPKDHTVTSGEGAEGGRGEEVGRGGGNMHDFPTPSRAFEAFVRQAMPIRFINHTWVYKPDQSLSTHVPSVILHLV